jgi:quinol monooxygenase YgiN
MALFYARVTTSKTDPSRLEEGIANFKGHVLPTVEQAPGFVGARLLVDRESGLASAITHWESVGALNAAEQLAQQLRQQVVQEVDAEVIDVDRFEILISDTPSEPVLPTYTRLVQICSQPEKLDAFIDHTKSVAHPRIREYEGFRSLVLAVNRMTGRCTVSVGFESAEARDASEEAGAANRSEAAEIAGAPKPTVSLRETVVATNVRAVSPA